MTTSGKRYRMAWRCSWYFQDGQGRPVGGGRQAFTLEASATAFAVARRAEGYTAEVWRQDTLPGIS